MQSPPRLVRIACLLLLPAVLQTPASAQEEETVNLLKARIDAFFHRLEDQSVEPAKAFDELLADSPLRGRQGIEKMVQRMEGFRQTFGQFVEAEWVDAQMIGQDVALVQYVYKMEKYPLVWHFTYYRPPRAAGGKGNWVVIAVRFDTRLELLGRRR